MTAPAIELVGLARRLGGFALGPLTLSVPRGAIFALIGPNGAGKTTTLDLLMGMGRPDSGEIRLLGMDLAAHEVEIKRKTAYVSPDLSYAAWGTVGRTIDFMRGFYPDWDAARCERLLGEFGLGRAEKVATLSFGARIKLALTLALSRDAELLLLDEPTVGLDVGSRRQLFSELLAYMQQEDRTIVISSHQLADVERFADHVAIIDRGKLLISGRMDELADRYAQLDVRLRNGTMVPIEGVRVLDGEGDRWRLLVDRQRVEGGKFPPSGIEVLAETRLPLEELFLAVLKK